jgi:hypothetical protein
VPFWVNIRHWDCNALVSLNVGVGVEVFQVITSPTARRTYEGSSAIIQEVLKIVRKRYAKQLGQIPSGPVSAIRSMSVCNSSAKVFSVVREYGV